MKVPSACRLFIGSLLLLVSCTTNYKYRVVKKQQYSIDNKLPVDSSISNLYLPYKLKIDSAMNTVVANTSAEIKRERPEGPLNNLAADAFAEVAKLHQIDFDFVHINYKSLRVPLPEGSIRVYKVFELLPYENHLVTVKFSGTEVNSLFQYMASLGGDPVSGASFEITQGRAVRICINGEVLNLKRTYTVLTNDYMANGGDGALMYLNATGRKNHSLKQRDAFLEYLHLINRKGVLIQPKIDGRVKSDKPIADE